MIALLLPHLPLTCFSLCFLTFAHLKPTDQTNQWPARPSMSTHFDFFLSFFLFFCLSPLDWERNQRFYQPWGKRCSLQLWCALGGGDKDSSVCAAKKSRISSRQNLMHRKIYVDEKGENRTKKIRHNLDFSNCIFCLSCVLWNGRLFVHSQSATGNTLIL